MVVWFFYHLVIFFYSVLWIWSTGWARYLKYVIFVSWSENILDLHRVLKKYRAEKWDRIQRLKVRRRPLLPRRRGRRAGVEDDGVDGRRAPGLTNHIPLLPRHSSTAATGYILQQPQLAAAVAGPVRILPQFESFYTNPR